MRRTLTRSTKTMRKRPARIATNTLPLRNGGIESAGSHPVASMATTSAATNGRMIAGVKRRDVTRYVKEGGDTVTGTTNMDTTGAHPKAGRRAVHNVGNAATSRKRSPTRRGSRPSCSCRKSPPAWGGDHGRSKRPCQGHSGHSNHRALRPWLYWSPTLPSSRGRNRLVSHLPTGPPRRIRALAQCSRWPHLSRRHPHHRGCRNKQGRKASTRS